MEKYKALKNKLQGAINYQKTYLPEINDYIEFLKGKQYDHKPTKDEATFNICHTTVQAILNSVLRGNSYMYVDPASEKAKEPAFNPLNRATEIPSLYVEKVINFWLDYLKVKYQVELSATDYAALGLGVTYVDWELQKDEDGKIVKDEPFVLHLPYKDFLIDPRGTTENIYEADHMIRKFVMPTKMLKKDKRYKHTKGISGDTKLSADLYTDKDLSECTTLYRIWCIDEGASYVMTEGNDKILRTIPNKLGREYPFVLMQNYKMPEELMPYGEVKVLYEPQKVLNKIFSLIMTHAKRVSTRQYAANSKIKKEELRKLKDAKDGEVLMVEGNTNPNEAIGVIQDAPLSSDVYRAYELINNAVVQLTSISQYRRSIMPQQQRKATEAAYIEQGTELSVNSKAEDIKEHHEEISRKLFKLITHEDNIDTKEVTYKNEKTGEWDTIKYNNQSFPGEYKFRWESGVEGPLNKATRQQKALGLLQTLANMTRLNPVIAQTVNWTELLKSTLKDFDIKNIDEILSPDPMMQQQMMGQGGVSEEVSRNRPVGQGETTPDVASELSRSIGGY